ncbi:hypothetical protein GDO86_017697 [Hymenochirus boettgeri]|uniref:GB1/RHD3-type G domain-containing protein n=1 Tax=Hymenochirus boettgeri TaxID=247094 RepID=A0A8T2IKM4_9PIPI|nr:hypothetical protein GDO86_017697 [Hymenochirus boettgeri]
MAPIPMMRAPVCFIVNEPGQRISVNQEAKRILEKITQPLVVVSVVGPYRTGKSYLMNKLAGVGSCGFSLGHTVEPKTKGIWMWCVPHPDKSARTLVLLDTEGLGDVRKGDSKNDSAILSLSLLLSSTLVYNSKGSIDDDALRRLYDTSELSECIMNKTSQVGGEDEEGTFTPLFVWTVRDFNLKLELLGRPITEDEYLENSLKDTPCKSLITEKKNTTRRLLRSRFPNRKCFTFEFPTMNSEVTDNLDRVRDKQLQPGFVEKTKDFCQFIYMNAPVKTLEGGQVVTGHTLGRLADSYVKVVTSKCIAYLDQSIKALSMGEISKIIKSITDMYERNMMSRRSNSLQEFQTFHKSYLKEALDQFQIQSFKYGNSQDNHESQLKETIEKKKEEILKRFETASEQKCKDIIGRLSQPMEKAVKQNKYHVAGGHEVFLKEKDTIVEKFHKEPDKGVKAETVLQEFLNDLKGTESVILKVDQELTESKPTPRRIWDFNDPTHLTQYIKEYKLKCRPFHRILIQLFGFAGHGKSSFVNSCLFVMGGGEFQDAAGEGSSQGAKTIDRRGHQLTESITIVDNRGFGKMDTSEAWQVYAQLCNLVPLNMYVNWENSSKEMMKLLNNKESDPDLMVPVFIYSSSSTFSQNEIAPTQEFLKNAQKLTGILPFIILTKKNSGKNTTKTFEQMGMEKIYLLENYTLSNHIATRGNHMPFLHFLKDVLDWVDFLFKDQVDFDSQQSKRKNFLIEKAFQN